MRRMLVFNLNNFHKESVNFFESDTLFRTEKYTVSKIWREVSKAWREVSKFWWEVLRIERKAYSIYHG